MSVRPASAVEPLGQHLLALLGSLAAGLLGAPEELGELGVVLALGVLDVGVQSQDVAQGLLGEPDDVVVLVLGAGDLAGLLRAHLASSLLVSGHLRLPRACAGKRSAAGRP